MTPLVGGPIGRRPAFAPLLLLPAAPVFAGTPPAPPPPSEPDAGDTPPVPLAFAPLLTPAPFVGPLAVSSPPVAPFVPTAVTLPLAALPPAGPPLPPAVPLAFGAAGPPAAAEPAAALPAPPASELGVLSENLSSLAMMCLPYVYFFSEFMCGRILCSSTLRCVGSDTSIIFCTT
uniref:Uncharacterized protein n=1 Tax=Anopheles dirus TaxID=7168 RepID=A0A182NWL9_9DIPT